MKNPCGKRYQQGGVSVILVALMLFVLALGLGFTQHNLAFEQKSSANQAKSALALEAAEAGVAWAQAKLNHSAPVDEQCQQQTSDTDPINKTFRSRYLAFDDATLQTNALSAKALCTSRAQGWQCQCVNSGTLLVTSADQGVDLVPTFLLTFKTLPFKGVVELSSLGCTQQALPCLPTSTQPSDAQTAVTVTLALGGGLRTAPVAPLVVKGNLTASQLMAFNADTQNSGLAVVSGGSAELDEGQVTNALGGTPSQAVASGITILSEQSDTRFFSSHFGMDLTTWREQIMVHTLACIDDCSMALGDVAGATLQTLKRMVYIDHDAVLQGPLELGTETQPVLIVVKGSLQLKGSVRVNGVMYAQSLRWEMVEAPTAWVRGATLIERDAVIEGRAQWWYDTAILQRLIWNTGSWVPLAGTWKDF